MRRARTLVPIVVPSESPQRNATEALFIALREFRTGRDRARVLPEFEHLARAADALDEVAEAVEDESERVEDPATLVALLSLCARVREELKQPEKAIMQWNDVLAALPTHAPALEALVRLLTAKGDLGNAAEVSLRRARVSAAGRDPAHHARYIAAAELFVAAGAPERALSTLDETLASSRGSPSVIAPASILRGQLLERSNPAEAAKAYALSSPEHHAAASAGLLRLLAVPEARSMAAEALEPVVMRAADRVEVLEALAEQPDMPERRCERLLALARARDVGREPRLAMAAYLRAGSLLTLSADTRVELERLAAGLDATDEVLASYQEWLERDPNHPDPSLLVRVAQLHDNLNHGDEAFEAWEWAAEASPSDVGVPSEFAARCQARGDFTRQAKALRWQLAATPQGPDRITVLVSLARLCEQEMGDDAGAAEAYQALADASPVDPRALEALKRLYARGSNTVGLAATLERELALAAAEQQTALRLQLAKLMRSAPENHERVLELLSRVLRDTPGEAEAIEGLVAVAAAGRRVGAPPCPAPCRSRARVGAPGETSARAAG